MTEESQERAIGRIEGKLDMILADQEKARLDRSINMKSPKRSSAGSMLRIRSSPR